MHRILEKGNVNWGKALAATLAATLAVGGAALAAAESAVTAATDKIKDLTCTLRVVKTDFNELGKISKDFSRSYYFKRMDITYQFPNKTRLQTKAVGMSGTLIFNGNTRYYKLPIRSETKDLTGQPGQKQSLLQLGVFSKDFLALDYEPVFVKKEGKLEVFRLNQRNTDNKSYEMVWVNPTTHIIEKRLSYNGESKLRMETRYKEAREIRPGIFLPTRIEVYNQFGKLGGIQNLEEIKVNQGVDEKLFETK
jgi:hypothetical protein